MTGNAAAATGALAAALAQIVTGLATPAPGQAQVASAMQAAMQRAATLQRQLSALVDRDAQAQDTLRLAHQLPKAVGDAPSARYGVLQRALISAAEVPLEIARAATAVAVLAADIADRSSARKVGDAAVAAVLADAVCRACAVSIRVHVFALADAGVALRCIEHASELTREASRAASRAVTAAERTY
jgi:formiminotetrahydrofolate cyclodeaminase